MHVDGQDSGSADAGEVRIVQFLLRRERMSPASFVGQGHATLRRVVLQPLKAAVSHQREVGRDLLQGAGLPQQGQIMDRPRDRGADLTQPPMFVDNDQRLARVRLLLTRVVGLLRRVVSGSLHALFGRVHCYIARGNAGAMLGQSHLNSLSRHNGTY